VNAPLPLLLLALALPAATARAEPALDRCAELAARADEVASGVGSRPLSEGVAEVESVLEAASVLGAYEVDGVRLRPRWTEHARAELKEATEPARVAAVAELAADRLYETCRHLATPAPAAGAADKAKLLEILSRPEYELRGRDEGFLLRLLERIRTWLRDVLATSRQVQSVALSVRTLFLTAACLLAAWLALRLARLTLRRRARARAVALEGPIVLDDPKRYEARAAQALSGGDGREAIRLCLLALLATLERLRLAAPGRAATNREVALHIAERGGSAALSEETGALVDWYDRAWYSLRPVSEAEARDFAAKVATLRDRASADARARAEDA
jgi:hypothetical protein